MDQFHHNLRTIGTRVADRCCMLLHLHDCESTIAESLRVSPHTIHTHVARLYRKVDVRSRCQLLAKLLVAFIEHNASAEKTASRPRSVSCDNVPSRRRVAADVLAS